MTVLGTLGSRVRDATVELGSLMSIVMLGFQNGRGGIQDQVNIAAVKGSKGSKARVTVRMPQSAGIYGKLIMGMGWMDSSMDDPLFLLFFFKPQLVSRRVTSAAAIENHHSPSSRF